MNGEDKKGTTQTGEEPEEENTAPFFSPLAAMPGLDDTDDDGVPPASLGEVIKGRYFKRRAFGTFLMAVFLGSGVFLWSNIRDMPTSPPVPGALEQIDDFKDQHKGSDKRQQDSTDTTSTVPTPEPTATEQEPQPETPSNSILPTIPEQQGGQEAGESYEPAPSQQAPMTQQNDGNAPERQPTQQQEQPEVPETAPPTSSTPSNPIQEWWNGLGTQNGPNAGVAPGQDSPR